MGRMKNLWIALQDAEKTPENETFNSLFLPLIMLQFPEKEFFDITFSRNFDIEGSYEV